MWDESKFLEDDLTHLTEDEAAYALREAYLRVIGEYPTNESLAILLAQTALETSRWRSMHNGNWGNIKSRPTDGHYWTMYECGEIINGRTINFKPPHDQCKFRAYLTTTDGAEDYIKFLSTARYKKALAFLKAGKVIDYTTELKKAGYFTASLNQYIIAMKSMFTEFMHKMDKLLAWSPPVKPEEILPPPPPEHEIEEAMALSSTIPSPPSLPQTPIRPTDTDSEPVDPKMFKNKNPLVPLSVAGVLAAIYLAVSTILQNCQ